MNIQAVFFDMGGTLDLYSCTPEMQLERTSAIQQRLLSAGINLGLSIEQLYQVVSYGLSVYHQWSINHLEELSPQKVWGEYIFAGHPEVQDKLSSIAEDLMCFIETQYFDRQMRPEIPFVLDSIRRMGLKTGLISNVNSIGQVPKNLSEYGIKKYFDPIVLSSDYGRRKPDPAIFHQAARLANVPASTCVHVGDRISRDIVGARKAGFRLAIQIKHEFDHGEEDGGATPDFIIDEMTELIDIIKDELNQSANQKLTSGMRSSPIRAILFDAGDILYYRPNRSEKFHAFLEEINIQVNHETLQKEKTALKEKAYRGLISQDEYKEAQLQLYGITNPEHIERGKQILGEEKKDVAFFEGVQQTLVTLKEKGYLLGIVTDTAHPVHVKLDWFEQGGIGHVWDSIISSKEVGARKPDPRIYRAVLKQMGIQAEEAIFVGHKASELDGAKTLGMKTIAFNYEEEANADYYLEKFLDLLKVPIISL